MSNKYKAIKFLNNQKSFYVPEAIKSMAGCTCTSETLARKLREASQEGAVKKTYYTNDSKEEIAIYGPR